MFIRFASKCSRWAVTQTCRWRLHCLMADAITPRFGSAHSRRSLHFSSAMFANRVPYSFFCRMLHAAAVNWIQIGRFRRPQTRRLLLRKTPTSTYFRLWRLNRKTQKVQFKFNSKFNKRQKVQLWRIIGLFNEHSYVEYIRYPKSP